MTEAPPSQAVAQAAPVRTCEITAVLPVPIIDLIRHAPSNELTRGHVLNRLGKVYPEALKKFDEIKDWIEFNYKKEVPPATMTSGRVGATQQQQAVAFSISADGTRTVFGRCSFRAYESGGGTYRLRPDQIISYAENCEDLETLVSDLRSLVEENISIEWRRGSDTDDVSYDAHETQDDEDTEIDVDEDTLESELTSWLRTHQPEILERLES